MPKTILVLMLWWPVEIQHLDTRRIQLSVWDVGQGLWVSYFQNHRCIHFDGGGERPVSISRFSNCTSSNAHYLSHLDWDHMKYLNGLHKKLGLCRVGWMLDRSRKKRLYQYSRIPKCHRTPIEVKEISISATSQLPNELSRVFVLKNWALLPGDSTLQAEKLWSPQVPQSIRILILGHHGSQTSTGTQLLERLPLLQLAIASSRRKKYGHPHRDVLRRLKRYGIPVLSTEDWGNIHIEQTATP